MNHSDFSTAQHTILDRCRGFDHLGDDFEKLSHELFRELGFNNIRRQKAGSQRGRDFSATRKPPKGDSELIWYLECKNLEDPISLKAVAEKVLWHLTHDRLTGGFVLFGPSSVTPDVLEIFERRAFPFSILNWTDEAFIKVVLMCPATTSKWFPDLRTFPPDDTKREWLAELWGSKATHYPPREPLQIFLSPEYDPPFCKAFFLEGEKLNEITVGWKYAHKLHLFNSSEDPIVVHSLSSTTIDYRPLPNRYLIQRKMKGAFTPIIYQYRPIPRPGGSLDFMNRRFLKIEPRTPESHILELLEDTDSGVYSLQFEVGYNSRGKDYKTHSQTIHVFVYSTGDLASSANHLECYVAGKFYPRLGEQLLRRSTKEWEAINNSPLKDGMIFLGPTLDDVSRGEPTRPLVQFAQTDSKTLPDGSELRRSTGKQQVLLDLGEVPDETWPPNPLSIFANLKDKRGFDIKAIFQELLETGLTPQQAIAELHDRLQGELFGQ